MCFNPIDDGEGAKKPPRTSFSFVASTKVEISPLNPSDF